MEILIWETIPEVMFSSETWNQVKTWRTVLNLWVSEVVLVVKNPTANTGDIEKHGFDPWVEKVPWKRAWQPTPVFLPGESPWTEEPDGLQSMGSQRVGHNWAPKHTNTLSFCVSFQCWSFGSSEGSDLYSKLFPSCDSPSPQKSSHSADIRERSVLEDFVRYAQSDIYHFRWFHLVELGYLSLLWIKPQGRSKNMT